jgi:PKD repeat protein
MLVGFAASVVGDNATAQGKVTQVSTSVISAAIAAGPSTRESQVLRSAEVSLAHGAGPAHGQSESCASATFGSVRCGQPATPAFTNHPSWYDVEPETLAIDSTYLAAMAWDPDFDNGILVYFGGCEYAGVCPDNFTWVYAGYSWVNESLTIGTAPPPILGEAMDWDPALSGIVMAGGGDVNGLVDAGTWLFTDGVWENITSTTGGLAFSPPSVYGAMAWDPATQTMDYLDGCTNTTCNSVWDGIWSLGATGGWLGVAANDYTFGEMMAYDAADQEMVAFGGYGPGGLQLNATWTLADGAWTNRTSSSVGCFVTCDLYPPGRSFGSMTWDGMTDSILLFGGINSSLDGFNDSWSFSANTWATFEIAGSFAPPIQAYSAMPVNSSDFAPALVGGDCSCSGSTFTLDSLPTLDVSAVSPNPADVGANVTVTVTGPAGAGSGPWLDLEADYGNAQGASVNVYGVNVTSPWAYTQTSLSYPTAGVYEMVFTVEDFFYVNATVYYNFTVVTGPQVTVHATPISGETGHAVAFNATVTAGETPYRYDWTFGDGGTSTLAAPTHSYAAAGTYLANLTVFDSGGGNVSGNVTVNVIAGVVAHASANVTTTDAGVPVSFTGSGSAGSGTYGPYDWTFGGGGTANTASATHTFAAAGTYEVYLNVTDSLGYVGSTSLNIVVNPALSAGTVMTSPTSPSAGTTVAFAVGATGGTAPLTYAWTFGDGGTASGASPTHAYTASGTYSVAVVITDALGQKITAHGTVTVSGGSSSGFSLSSGTGLYVLIGVLVAVLVVVAAVVLMRRGRGPAAAPGSPPQGVTGPGAPPPGASP